MENKSQQQMVLAHLKQGKSITPLQALQYYGCFRLAAIIFNLRQAEHKIITTMNYKGGKNWAEYKLKEFFSCGIND